ncbi:MAG TPA: hypothetical protein VMI72_03225 [Roseiarcus sp.]|nr:hypothetical protein [Roseiarcus sp.]
MIDDLIRDLQVLWKADSLIGRIWLNAMARRLALFVFAALIAVFGLGMANVAAFYALQASFGPVWAAVIVAVADLVLAALVLTFASKVQPGREIELALEVRKMAIASLQTDSAEIKLAVDSIRRDIQQTKESIAGFVHDPLNAAAERLLVPAAMSLVRGLRAKKD